MTLGADPWGHIAAASIPRGFVEGEVAAVGGVVAQVVAEIQDCTRVDALGVGLDFAII